MAKISRMHAVRGKREGGVNFASRGEFGAHGGMEVDHLHVGTTPGADGRAQLRENVVIAGEGLLVTIDRGVRRRDPLVDGEGVEEGWG